MYFELFMGSDIRDYFFYLRDDEDTVLVRSEAYNSRKRALEDIETVRKNVSERSGFNTGITNDDRSYFNIKDAGGHIVGTSAIFADDTEMNRQIELIVSGVQAAGLKDRTLAND